MEPYISLITLGVSDLVRSTAFYKQGLGLPAKEEFEGVTFLNLRGTWLALYYALIGELVLGIPTNRAERLAEMRLQHLILPRRN